MPSGHFSPGGRNKRIDILDFNIQKKKWIAGTSGYPEVSRGRGEIAPDPKNSGGGRLQRA